MPNNNYLRSTKRERELVNSYRKDGWDSGRTAGSHSPWDLYAFNPKTGEVHLIQIKTKKGKRRIVDKNVLYYKNPKLITWTRSWE